ncbi:MAG: ABC transporter ATP-binding protein [Lachnospiraceae bacterium]|nr:ABC transporter ATP-binding protein [Lachnospiraceae bacterium]MBR5762510.1 ABC transporter ATP-binding protein [Lachnospiraceae bacterium]
MSNAIVTNGLIKRYKDKTAVDGISMTVEEGKLVALLGVNGAGKTTTIRMLTCLSKPTAGTAQVLGHDVVKEADEVKKLVGISTQDTAVAENLTVRENLEFMASLYLDKSRINGAVEKAIEAFGLEEFRNKKAKHLSGGWKRKLSIAMAIIGEPKILFLDEPTLGLDVLARRQLWTEIEEIKKHMTIVLTTHYMEEAEALADEIFVMIDGKVAADGTLSELEARTGKKGLEEVFVKIAEEY